MADVVAADDVSFNAAMVEPLYPIINAINDSCMQSFTAGNFLYHVATTLPSLAENYG